ncbi:glycosyltransferase [Emticicia sp. CRIBPO]|uniref:glycosyltransferase n=1 Tax=Emticicia sp. CRIBPO TaxID=2683258 RepID=UPI001412BD21|nr:glycosyltransferase [Emticicia sp. CRIBPO]NBA86721.1 glycosyltransferase [Emticicia sp. CRIBPO]
MHNNTRKILFITSGDQTGANTALIKIAEALHNQEHRVAVLVRNKSEYNPIVTQLPARNGYASELGFLINKNGSKTRLNRDPKYLFNTINEENSYQDTTVILKHLSFIPEIIFVGITFDFLTSTDILKLSEATLATVYNMAVDMNHFTGGCHFAWDCTGYIKGCNSVDCPAVLDPEYKELVSRNFSIKKENAQKGNFKILAGTKWTATQAQDSLIYKNQQPIFNIPGIIETGIFNPGKRKIAKEVFGLSDDKFYILAGAENTLDPRKGYIYFVKSLHAFWEKLSQSEREKVEVLSLTRIIDEESHKEIRFKKTFIPYIKDDRLLALMYQAADAYVNSSLEDSGPAMLIEAMACGVPVASFNMGAAQDYITNEQTGYIVENKNHEALAVSLLRIFRATSDERLVMGEKAFAAISEKGSMNQAMKTMDQLFKHEQQDFFSQCRSISVALCTHNGEKHIKEQLESILNQNLVADEIVICDDASTDQTWNILESYRTRYPQVFRIYKNKKQLGIVKNFEKAINLCSREIIFLCDQDDVWFPHKTETVIRVFNRFPHIEAVSHNLQICKEDNELTEYSIWDTMGFGFFQQQKYPDKDYFSHTLFFGNMVTGAALCIKKPREPLIFREGYPKVIHDYQLGIEYLSKKTMHFHHENLGLYRQHEEQQIGPVLDKIDQHEKSINIYYAANIPILNLIHIARREYSEDIFRYIKHTNDQYLIRLAKQAKINQLKNCFRLKIWTDVIKLILRKLTEKLLSFLKG